ncbi:peptidyl-tRNA hydrolase [Streptomyces albus]|uniref:peptidyl-tRNA hydrolase n=1 Tax=Streptomyces albus TaxID=1888 RepID=UPI00099E019C|nr:peptidyl-tRNA hydrolase [Streptomyces albus]
MTSADTDTDTESGTSTGTGTGTGTDTGTNSGAGAGPGADRGSHADTAAFRHSAPERDAAPQFVLPLVVRIEKAAPPSRTDALETAARAVLVLLSDERAADPDGAWYRAVRSWQDARIRKVVRRARGAEWRRAAALPGITVTGGSAEVRVYPPVPVDGWPKELVKLQVSGTELADPVPPPAPASGRPVLWLSPELEMSAGKAMAQAGHGAQLAWLRLPPAERSAWRAAGFPLAVRTADRARWARLTRSGLPLVRDAGFTEIAPGSCTVVAEHPALKAR